MKLLDKLEAVISRYEEVTHSLGDSSVISNQQLFLKLSKEHAELEPIVKNYEEYKKVKSDLQDCKTILAEEKDQELKQLAKAESDELEVKEQELKQELMLLLVPKDPNDDKNIIIEIRAGAGGDEAALFGEELFEAYVRYSEKQGWRTEILTSSASSVGGYKEVIAQITGDAVYSNLKYEQGVHRVQRVPQTESQGRVHTSTVTVAIMPEAEDVDLDIDEKDLRVDVFRASGPGGQSVNTTDSAVRITHIPTGEVVQCQDEKSQHKNKAKALSVLRARLLAKLEQEQHDQIADERRSQIGTGARSEKIRTYNFPQSRLTDHRISLSLYQLDSVMAGDLHPVIQPLQAHYRAEALKAESGEE